MINFMTLSEKQFRSTNLYKGLYENHLLISIGSKSTKLDIPNLPSCKGVLKLEFDDILCCAVDKVCFNSDDARKILDFVDSHINSVSLIVCQCKAGLSSSTAIAAALSKIINHKDDGIFMKTIPNMLVYTTILDEYFLNENVAINWPSIYFVKNKSMSNSLDMATYRSWKYRFENGGKDE